MDKQLLLHELRCARAYLLHTASVFDAADEGFSPGAGGMTVAQQVAHTAFTLDWFVEGATRPEGFSMDFEAHIAALQQVTTLAQAKAEVERAWAATEAWLSGLDAARLEKPLPAGMVMPGMPTAAVVLGIIDHTAHHRGALSAYARSLGKTPPMPYEADIPWGN